MTVERASFAGGRRADRLRDRLAWLESRIAASDKDLYYDKGEAAALRWALERLDAIQPLFDAVRRVRDERGLLHATSEGAGHLLHGGHCAACALLDVLESSQRRRDALTRSERESERQGGEE